MDKLKKELEILRSWGIESIPVDKVLSMIDEVEEEEDEIVVEDQVDALFEGIASSIVTASPVGGRIFYIDDTADGVYEFFDVSGNPIENVQVGDRPYYYRVIKKGSKDKYYVYHDELYTSSMRWTYYRGLDYGYESLGTSKDVGSGKTNTEKVMTKDDGAYITADSNWYPTIWYQLQQIRNAKAGGCDDWFIPSRFEVKKLREAIIAGDVLGGTIAGSSYKESIFCSKRLQSSSEYSYQDVWAWSYNLQSWTNSNKYNPNSVFFIRAF